MESRHGRLEAGARALPQVKHQIACPACARLDERRAASSWRFKRLTHRIALVNLISNAIRHSPAGSTVEIAVQPEPSAVTIAVSDDGPGIVPGDAGRIFDPWYQGVGTSDGLGLGLWIVRQIVEWHRGRVTLDTTPGQGSTFNIVLPQSRSAASAVER